MRNNLKYASKRACINLANSVASKELVIVSKLCIARSRKIGGVVTSRDSFSRKIWLNYISRVYSVTYTFYSYVFLLV